MVGDEGEDDIGGEEGGWDVGDDDLELPADLVSSIDPFSEQVKVSNKVILLDTRSPSSLMCGSFSIAELV